MPRDYELLQPWTQHLLRMARSGKVGAATKRKADPDSMDDDKPEDEAVEEAKPNLEDRGYIAKKWKPIPEAQLEPEHKHFEFLAKRRRGLPSLYHNEIQNGIVPMRKTKVQKAGPDGEINLYEVLVPEGQAIEGEVADSTELADVKPIAAAPGTVIEGVGIANDDGVVVAEHLKPVSSLRRNRPPPKKKGGPGRGKKRVTFTNSDGSTYTTVVPNATKIVPQPGQTVKHVAKGEEPLADVSKEQAAQHAPDEQQDGEGEGEGEGQEGDDDDEGDEDDDDDDDDREEGELSDEDDAPLAGNEPTAEPQTADSSASKPVTPAPPTPISALAPPTQAREPSSSPDLPLAKSAHSRQSSLITPPIVPAGTDDPEADTDVIMTTAADDAPATFDDGDEDLLGNLEKHLEDEHRSGEDA